MSRKPIRDGILTWLGKGLLLLARWFPRSVGYFLGGIAGRLTYMFSGRERRKALSSLAIAYAEEKTEKERKRLALASFKNMGRILFEFIKLPGLSNSNLLKRVEVRGIEHLERARDNGNGVIIATGHIGNWEIMGLAAVELGFPLNVIAREIHISGFNKLVIDIRRRAGITTIVRDSDGAGKQILKALKNKEMLALLIDQDIAAESQFVDFFGQPALTPTGAARLALKTDSPLVAACCHRLGIGKFAIHLTEVAFDRKAGEDEAVLDGTRKATEQLEAWIRAYPDQWPWIHQRWKSQPD